MLTNFRPNYSCYGNENLIYNRFGRKIQYSALEIYVVKNRFIKVLKAFKICRVDVLDVKIVHYDWSVFGGFRLV